MIDVFVLRRRADDSQRGSRLREMHLLPFCSPSFALRSVPVTAPDERATTPLRVCLLLPTRSERSLTHPEGPFEIGALLFRQQTYTRLIVALATWRRGLCEKFGPRFFGDDRVMDQRIFVFYAVKGGRRGRLRG